MHWLAVNCWGQSIIIVPILKTVCVPLPYRQALGADLLCTTSLYEMTQRGYVKRRYHIYLVCFRIMFQFLLSIDKRDSRGDEEWMINLRLMT